MYGGRFSTVPAYLADIFGNSDGRRHSRPLDHRMVRRRAWWGKHWMSDEELTRERALQHEDRITADAETAACGSFGLSGVLSWVAVGIPFFVGLYIAIEKAAALF